ncbi:hypothetical protein HDU67_010230 [Dinochytrium kinnereticum]|nr:hypothetical protein HDU67_010230 [Dinochytrium kinnereticum]
MHLQILPLILSTTLLACSLRAAHAQITQAPTQTQFTFVPLPTLARCTGSNQFTCEKNTTLTELVLGPSSLPQANGSGSDSGGLTGAKRIAVIAASIIGGIVLLAVGTFFWVCDFTLFDFTLSSRFAAHGADFLLQNKMRGGDKYTGSNLDELSQNKPYAGPAGGGPGEVMDVKGVDARAAAAAAGGAGPTAGIGRRNPGEPGLNGDLASLPISGEYPKSSSSSGYPAGRSDQYGYDNAGRPLSPTGSLTPSMSASVVRGDSGAGRFDNMPPMPNNGYGQPPKVPQGYGGVASQAYPSQQSPFSAATPNANGPYYSQAYPQQQAQPPQPPNSAYSQAPYGYASQSQQSSGSYGGSQQFGRNVGGGAASGGYNPSPSQQPSYPQSQASGYSQPTGPAYSQASGPAFSQSSGPAFPKPKGPGYAQPYPPPAQGYPQPIPQPSPQAYPQQSAPPAPQGYAQQHRVPPQGYAHQSPSPPSQGYPQQPRQDGGYYAQSGANINQPRGQRH